MFKAVDIYRSYPDQLKYIGKNLYMSLEVKADECVECEKCIEKCPAGLNIPEKLKEAVTMFA